MSIITNIIDEYWKRRTIAAVKLEESESYDWVGPSFRNEDALHPLDAKLSRSMDGLEGALGDLKNKLMEWWEENKDEDKSNRMSYQQKKKKQKEQLNKENQIYFL